MNRRGTRERVKRQPCRHPVGMEVELFGTEDAHVLV